MTELNSLGTWLSDSLLQLDDITSGAQKTKKDAINVVGAGGGLTAAYEQLRNAAENAEEHLLTQNAIRRFYKQLFMTRDEELLEKSGRELITELTLAGYVPNNSVAKRTANDITKLARDYYKAYEALHPQAHYSLDTVHEWTLDVLAAEIESRLNNHACDELVIQFAHQYYSQLIDEKMLKRQTKLDTSTLSTLLYIAIHKVLLKSNDGLVRARLLARHQISPKKIETYTSYNAEINALLASDLLDTVRKIVDRQGAPLRILRKMIENDPEFARKLHKKDGFLDEFEKEITKEYARVSARIDKAIVRSVVFLIITKVLIGVAIEVPYDLLVHSHIVWVPLIINLLFPPVYMVLLRATHQLPSYANTEALVDRVETMFYGEQGALSRGQLAPRRYGNAFSVAYAVTGLLVFAGVSWLLWLLNFSVMHIVIFFVFLSAASFLGFRLSRLIRELEVVRSSQNGMTLVRDLLYLPFVLLGQWMSDKYSKVNIVTIVLDMLIELPLKTILRLIRQWGAFIDDRKDSI